MLNKYLTAKSAIWWGVKHEKVVHLYIWIEKVLHISHSAMVENKQNRIMVAESIIQRRIVGWQKQKAFSFSLHSI